jgi:diphthamide synthase (EF-2-diphthine--ammonia ligase)
MRIIAQVIAMHLDDAESMGMGSDTIKNLVKVLGSIKEKNISEVVFTGALSVEFGIHWYSAIMMIRRNMP